MEEEKIEETPLEAEEPEFVTATGGFQLPQMGMGNQPAPVRSDDGE